jgi:hypothetical protein
MKKLWLFFKISFIVLNIFIVTDGINASAQEQWEGGCNTTQACNNSTLGYCSCTGAGCTGCYVLNGTGGCGSCFTPPS